MRTPESIRNLGYELAALSGIAFSALGFTATESKAEPPRAIASTAIDLAVTSARPALAEPLDVIDFSNPNIVCSFFQGSKAQKAHNEARSFVERNKPVPTEKIEAVFNALANEKEGTVGRRFIQDYLGWAQDSAATEAVLKFVEAHQRPEYLKATFQMLEAQETVHLSPQQIEKYGNSEHEEIRRSVRIIKNRDLIPLAFAGNATLGQIVMAASYLPERSLEVGNEVRLADKFYSKLLTPEELKADKDLKMALFHSLLKIENRYPGWLHALETQNPEAFKNLCNEMRTMIKEKRAAMEERVILGKGVKLVSTLHAEQGFTAKGFKDLCQRYGASYGTCFKPSETNYAPSKSGFLKEVSKASADRGTMVTLWSHNHGNSTHIWFASGSDPRAASDGLTQPAAISYREYAQALLNPQLKDIAAGKYQSIDLSHLNLIFDQCIQYDFAHNFYNELFKIAKANKVEITGLPTVITPAQRGMVSWKESSGDCYSFLERAVWELNEDGKTPLTIGGMLRADTDLNVEFARGLAAFHEHKKDKNGKEIAYVEGEDPAIFSNEIVDIEKVLNSFQERATAQEQRLPATEDFRDRAVENLRIFFEIGTQDREQNPIV